MFKKSVKYSVFAFILNSGSRGFGIRVHLKDKTIQMCIHKSYIIKVIDTAYSYGANLEDILYESVHEYQKLI